MTSRRSSGVTRTRSRWVPEGWRSWRELTDRSELWGFGDARLKSGALPRLYRNAAELKGVPFLDAAAIVEADSADGVHLGEDAHAVLGHAIAIEARRLLGG